VVVAMAMLLRATDAFQATVVSPTARRTITTTSQLHAWTLLPADASPFKSPWYNEYNPTARTTVYAE